MKLIIKSYDGNIGAGKSTRAEEEKKNPDIHVIIEDPNTNPYFKEYYTRKGKIFEFQDWNLNHKIDLITEKIRSVKSGTILIDRSLDADVYVFCKMHYQNGKITKDQFEYLVKKVEDFKKSIAQFQYDYYYISTPVNECLKRIKIRGRKEESDLKTNLLEVIEKLHSELKINYKIIKNY